ncbi:nucleotide sugar dehydrogenase [Desulfoferula mesophila]|uniref:NDP-sugar dehydrogenase n=1 Tax=Desulfoferula mesophila TaxID=3058419 RepID=A0AAU9EG26_9BACT|nr:NDP-sugar dehydrogenase [Desulfoferula mesophilus]
MNSGETLLSISPDGESFPLPGPAEYEAENQRLAALAAANREMGREIVVVMGVGFVGSVMAAVVADSVGPDDEPARFVIGMQRPSSRSYWKIPLLNRGEAPVKAEDPEVARIVKRCVQDKQTLTASFSYEALALADVVVVDIQCDYNKTALADVRLGGVEMRDLEASLKIIGEMIPPHCLVLMETTVPPGTTEYVANPVITKEFKKRGITSEPLLAHSFERVMPGREYVRSIKDYWRVCAGTTPQSRQRVIDFLSGILNVKDYPLTVLDRPLESETTKIVENSYRATILAFMDEWSNFAENAGVDIVKVVECIRKRPTHSNLLFPGPGVGGYCLPKDGGLGVWAYHNLLGFQAPLFKMTPMAIDINDTRPLHAAGLVRDALKEMGRLVPGSRIAVLGAAYREDVGDTRYSGSELVVRRLAEMGADIEVHDPYVAKWWEFVKQDEYPVTCTTRACFFRNQEGLMDLDVSHDLPGVLRGADAVVLCVRHHEYLELEPDWVVEACGGPVAIIDCFALLDDQKIRRYFELGCEVKGLGRGHVKRIKDSLKK